MPFFGLPGSNNDINVLDRSPVFDGLLQGRSPPVQYILNDDHEKVYDMGYYLADGIYPKYATLISTISDPKNKMEKEFAMHQERVRKDVERAFGVLQSRFAIVKGPARFWQREDLQKIMKT